jgi:hypothetical protein
MSYVQEYVQDNDVVHGHIKNLTLQSGPITRLESDRRQAPPKYNCRVHL